MLAQYLSAKPVQPLFTVYGRLAIIIQAKEPPGLTVGRVLLEDGDVVFGILAEAYLVTGLTEITSYGGWRSYLQRRSAQS
jgi:hypothetical protein